MGKIKFGTDGWRAVIAEDFTFANLGIVVEAVTKYLKNEDLSKKGIFIGYDNRFLSEDFAAFSAKIIAKNSMNAFIPEMSVPTPVTAFMVINMKLDGAIMITASHNPARYNGIKFIPSYGGPAEDFITKAIEKIIKDNKTNTDLSVSLLDKILLPDKKTNIKTISDFSEYRRKIINIIDEKIIKKIRPTVAIDTMFGAGSSLFPDILNGYFKLGGRVFNDSRDCLFGGMLPDPSLKNLKILKEEVLKNDLDMGLALDGDADRFGIIDGRGEYINPNNAISIILFYMLETKDFDSEDIAVRTVATTHLIDDICEDKNIGHLETPVGFKFISKAMRKGNVLIGGEESGGLSLKGHIPEKDGLLACLKMLEIQSYLKMKYGKTFYLSDYLKKIIFKEYGNFYNTRLDIEVPLEKKSKIIDFFLSQKSKKLEGVKINKIIDIDGAKLIFENKSWLLVRPSGTEPLIRCYIESRDEKYFQIIKKFVIENIK